MGKELTWGDVGKEYDPAQRKVLEMEATPHKGLGTKAYERLWGTDVEEDPLEFIRLGSQLVGGIGGSVAGAAVGGAAGTAVAPGPGTVVGAGLGATAGGFVGGMLGTVAPEGVMEAAEFLGIVNEGTRDRLGLTDNELDTVVEGEAILDMITGGGLMAARVGARAFGKAFTGLGIFPGRGGASKKMAEFAAKHGVNMLPVQVGKRELPRGFVSVLGKFPLVAIPLKRNIVKAEQEFKAAFEALPSSIAPIATINEVSHAVFMDAKNLVTTANKEFQKHREDIFRQADHAGSRILPTETASRIGNVLSEIAKETPQQARFSKKAKPTLVMQDLQRFLTNEIAPIFKKHKAGSVTAAPQTFRQMNTVLEKVDEKIAALAKKEGLVAQEAMDRLQRVRQAVQIDMYTNIQGTFGKDIAGDLAAIDKKYSETVADIFTTTSAKKFGTVRKGGLSNLGMPDVPTGVSMDNLTEVLLKSGDVSELTDIHRLVEPETFKKMAAYSLHKQIDNAYTDGGKVLNLQTLTKSLGLDAPKSTRYAYTKKMLELSGGLSMEDLGKLVEVGELIGKVEAPNASVFIARRGIMGGTESIFKAIIPAVAVGSAGTAAGGVGGGIIATMAFIGGSHMVGRMISDPRIARPLHKVLDKEATSMVKKGAALQIGRIFANQMVGDGEFTMKEGLDWRRHYEKTINALTREIDHQKTIQSSRVPTGE